MGIGKFIYDFQALIGAGIAVGAAYWAARPVYQQLKATQTQANGVLRDMLLQRQAEIRKARLAIAERVQSPLAELARDLGLQDEVERINEHQAHHHEMSLWHSLDWLRTGYQWRDSLAVVAEKDALASNMDTLVRLLAEVHYPASQNQDDPENPISDDDWAQLEARGEAAKDEVPAALSATQAAARQFLSALESEQAAVGARLGKLNEQLTAA